MDENRFAAPEGFSLLPRSADAPPEADFCLTVRDNAMAPFIKAGDSVYVSARQPLEEFDVGVFFWNGRVYCRQWCEDYSGALHLLAASPADAEANICLSRRERKGCVCLGKVLLDKKLPRSVAF